MLDVISKLLGITWRTIISKLRMVLIRKKISFGFAAPRESELPLAQIYKTPHKEKFCNLPNSKTANEKPKVVHFNRITFFKDDNNDILELWRMKIAAEDESSWKLKLQNCVQHVRWSLHRHTCQHRCLQLQSPKTRCKYEFVQGFQNSVVVGDRVAAGSQSNFWGSLFRLFWKIKGLQYTQYKKWTVHRVQ